MQRTLIALFVVAALALPATADAARSPEPGSTPLLTFAAGAGRADVVSLSHVSSAWSLRLGRAAPRGNACGP